MLKYKGILITCQKKEQIIFPIFGPDSIEREVCGSVETITHNS